MESRNRTFVRRNRTRHTKTNINTSSTTSLTRGNLTPTRVLLRMNLSKLRLTKNRNMANRHINTNTSTTRLLSLLRRNGMDTKRTPNLTHRGSLTLLSNSRKLSTRRPANRNRNNKRTTTLTRVLRIISSDRRVRVLLNILGNNSSLPNDLSNVPRLGDRPRRRTLTRTSILKVRGRSVIRVNRIYNRPNTLTNTKRLVKRRSTRRFIPNNDHLGRRTLRRLETKLTNNKRLITTNRRTVVRNKNRVRTIPRRNTILRNSIRKSSNRTRLLNFDKRSIKYKVNGGTSRDGASGKTGGKWPSRVGRGIM